MAIIKIKHSKGSLKKIIDYVMDIDKTDEKFISGKDCLPENVFESMTATKESFNKTDGRSYDHIIQSFKPGEVGPTMAREIGKELAEKQFKGYEVLIATHINKEHIHNHLVINSVSFEDGRKLHTTMQDFRELKKVSDKICSDRGLSVIKEPYARNHYSMAEYKLAEKGQSIWKEQLRSAIDEAKEHSKTIVEMGDYLEKNFNIDMKIQNKNLSFLHPEKQKYCRGSKLGNAYNKDEIMGYFKIGPEVEKLDRVTKAAKIAAAKEKEAVYSKWEKSHPREAKEVYKEWNKAHPEEAAKRIATFKRYNRNSPLISRSRIIAAESYENWKRNYPEEAKVPYREWKKEHPKEAKAAHEEWEKENPEEAKATSEKKYLDGKIEYKQNSVLSRVGFGIEGIANKIARNIEKESLRADQKKVIKARGKAKERERDRDGGRDRDRGYRGR